MYSIYVPGDVIKKKVFHFFILSTEMSRSIGKLIYWKSYAFLIYKL